MRRRLSLIVDAAACGGRGVCAEPFGERVPLDPCGPPLLPGGDVPTALHERAARAAASRPSVGLPLLEVPA
jgi:hypothetical protein